jgi:tetratricopeptide (TPR) repeat protein
MVAMLDSLGDAPSPDEIRTAIDRITVSDVFNRSPQLGSFLRFVVEAALSGKGHRIKAYTIGVEVLRRDTSFDPQIDPIVRVEATRLRRAIERYYAGPGSDDPVIVDLPRGTYVPTFRHRDVPIPVSGAASATQSRFSGARVSFVAAIAAIVLLAFGSGLALRQSAWSDDRGGIAGLLPSSLRSADQQLPPGNGMPAIYIEPLRIIGARAEGGLAPRLLLEKINGAFARFDTVNVVYGPRATVGSSAAASKVDYQLSSAVEYRDGHANVQFRLIDVGEGNVVWSRSFDRLPSAEEGVVEEKIVGTLAEALLQSFGVIRARDRAKHLASGAGDPRYRCILEAADSLRTQSRSEHEQARTCLEKLTAADPSFSVGYAFLAMLYGREHQYGIGARPGDTPPLERALRAVRRSIELNPASSRSHVVLMLVLFHRGEVQKAFAAGDKALELNPYDMLAPAEYGGRLVLAGEVEKGMAMLRRAGEFTAIRPAWQHFYVFMGAYLRNDLQEAAYQAGQITADNYAPTHLSRALLAVSAGDAERARTAIARLVALMPGWREPRHELRKISPNPAVVERLAHDLARAGMAGL